MRRLLFAFPERRLCALSLGDIAKEQYAAVVIHAGPRHRRGVAIDDAAVLHEDFFAALFQLVIVEIIDRRIERAGLRDLILRALQHRLQLAVL